MQLLKAVEFVGWAAGGSNISCRMAELEPEEEGKKAPSPDDGLGAAGGGGLGSSLPVPGVSSACSSPLHSPSWTRANEDDGPWLEENGSRVDESAERRLSPLTHLVDPPDSSDCLTENASDIAESGKPVESLGKVQPPQHAVLLLFPPIPATPDRHGDSAELVVSQMGCNCEEMGNTCYHVGFWKAEHIINGDQYKLELQHEDGVCVTYPPPLSSYCRSE